MEAERVPAAEIRRLEACLDYHFTRPELLLRALTHRSAAHERSGNRRTRLSVARRGAGSNERLEFIGDRVLGLVMAEWLIERFPDEQEGALGPRHAHLVSRTVLAQVAHEMQLQSALDVAEHEARAGVRQMATVLADAVEAVLGALYLDGGLDPARAFVRRMWREAITAQARPPKDPKTALQEWVLGRGLPLPQYRVVSSDGPSHAPRFVIAVDAQGKTGQGIAGSKRAAESDAASDLLRQLGVDSQAAITTNRKGQGQ
ncbi:ribonuclease III [Komagataeibacter xylinus]|uniref:Ribonuclease 3 n=1 Tax=Komagataeibacter xylinus TaxID=28448 RepID=A0A318PLZ8_KOMXY|nr:ribonuclease III [Komagataeibacter xylinus]AZV39656.1 ribonuclease III [Komagataeibacter xylinus]PYD58486.1 ribonuclease III [Komagataeibacter xylinus]GBQ68439.1 ribonuclease III [Komagataeibacter xylinus NBRC 15237]